MTGFGRIVIAFLLLLAFQNLCLSQTKDSSISGRITIEGKGAANVTVILVLTPDDWNNRKVIASAKTDDEGNFQLKGLAAGKYRVAPNVPTSTGANRSRYDMLGGKDITLNENEKIENINFTLKRGGVITGRVTDREGRPVIAQKVVIQSTDGRTEFGGAFGVDMYETDDRGIYRVYGLPAGNYLVSLGDVKNDGSISVGMKARTYYSRTFHPAATEKSEAKVIELEEGEEESGVNITLGVREKTYALNGRVVEVTSNKPVDNVNIGYGQLSPDGRGVGSYGYDTRSDATGRFSVEGIKPGRYAAFVVFDDKTDKRYSDAVAFEIIDSDVDDAEIKVRRGASISGVAILEGATDATATAKFTELNITASGWGDSQATLTAPNFRTNKIGADGSFRFNGLTPGKIRMILGYPQPKNFNLLRVEHNGVALKDNTLDLSSEPDATNVRMIIEYAPNTLRGKVNVTGGTLPQNARLIASISRVGQENMMSRYAEVDARGQFAIEGLSAGEYEITIIVSGLPNREPQNPLRIKQRVNINSLETNVTLTLNLEGNQ